MPDQSTHLKALFVSLHQRILTGPTQHTIHLYFYAPRVDEFGIPGTLVSSILIPPHTSGRGYLFSSYYLKWLPSRPTLPYIRGMISTLIPFFSFPFLPVILPTSFPLQMVFTPHVCNVDPSFRPNFFPYHKLYEHLPHILIFQ